MTDVGGDGAALVRERRAAHDLTRERLALRAACSAADLAALEEGRRAPSVEELSRLLLALGEELVIDAEGRVSAQPLPHAYDPGQIARHAALPIGERLARALEWNDFAATIATAPRRPLPPQQT